MAAYQREKIGKYVRYTEAKIRCQKKEIEMKDEIAAISKRTSELETTITNSSAENENLQQTTTKAKHENKQAEERLKEIKSDMTQLKTVYNPRNVKQCEETKEKQILQFKKRVETKVQEIKSLKDIIEKAEVTTVQAVKEAVQQAEMKKEFPEKEAT